MSGTLSLTFNVSSAPTDATVTLPIVENPSEPITFTIDWGDLTTPDSILTHTYGSNGLFTATITITAGSVTAFGSNGWQGVSILTAVSATIPTAWGLPGVTSFAEAFRGASQLTSVPTDVPASVKIMTSMFNMFPATSVFNQDISVWDVSNVEDMSYMFSYANAFNQDISSWNVSSVLYMNQMFADNSAFNNGAVGNVGGKPLTWTNTGLVRNMRGMFYNADAFNQDISSWNVSSVDEMTNMFYSTNLFNNGAVGDVGGKDLNWTTTGNLRVTDSMFANALAFNQDISSWDVRQLNNMSSMFNNANKFNNGAVGDVGGKPLTWTTSNLTSMANTFGDARKFNQDISSWNVSNVTNMTGLFENCFIFNRNISSWNVGRVTNMYNMFSGATIFDQNIRYWVVGLSTPLTNMFSGATAMAARYGSVPGYGTTPLYTFFNLEPPKTLSLTFYVTGVNQEVILPISGTDVTVSIVWGDGTTNTSLSHTYLTGTWTAIVTITGGSVTTFGAPSWVGATRLIGVATTSLTDWGLGPDVTSFAGAFRYASLLVSVPTYLPSSVRNLSFMFQEATTFNQNISGWNVSQVTNMEAMFGIAIFFNQNISTWNVSQVTNMAGMFGDAINFNQNIRVWVVRSPTNVTGMFTGATAMTSRYGSVPTYGATPEYAFFTGPPVPYPCFLEGTQILCLENGEEVYRSVQNLRKGDLVKTIYHGYLPIHMIGTTAMYNPNNNDRVASRLYKCPKENYPGLLEDLYITGCHSILVPWLTYEQAQKTISSLGRLFVTDKHCRLMAWVDEKAEPYKMAGVYNIYHIALENNDYYMNYGIYANGLLVESCSKRYLMEMSNMRILGEEDCSLTDGSLAEENVFHKMPALIESC